MDDLARYQGLGQFGRAYRMVYANDCHAPGSVDRVLLERMVRICPETASYLYRDYTSLAITYTTSRRPELERHLRSIGADRGSIEEKVNAIVGLCRGLTETAANRTEDDLLFGGTEEEVIQRGSDWCTDLARVACVLAQVAGLPSRIVFLANTASAYSGHAIVDIHRNSVWGAVDSTNTIVYQRSDGMPVSTWEIISEPPLVDAGRSGLDPSGEWTGQFRAAAPSNYRVSDVETYDYTVSSINAYYRSILSMASRGWPGGPRWLHGEDDS